MVNNHELQDVSLVVTGSQLVMICLFKPFKAFNIFWLAHLISHILTSSLRCWTTEVVVLVLLQKSRGLRWKDTGYMKSNVFSQKWYTEMTTWSYLWNEAKDCVCHVSHVVVELSHRSMEISSNEFNNLFYRAFVVKNIAGRFRSPNNKEEETSLLSEATPKATQYNTKWGRKVFEELHLRRQNKCAMLEIVGVAGLKCDNVEDLTVYSSTCRQLR